MSTNDLTTRDYWEAISVKAPRMRLPSSLNVDVLNQKRLLRSYIKPGMKVLEIGCAPAKMLAYCAARLDAQVAGIDYSEPGMKHATKLFEKLGIKGDLRCEDVFLHSFPRQTFDLVYSVGVVEHFVNPLPIVDIHTELLKPGGKALIIIPNYGRVYGYLEGRFCPDYLLTHNRDIMSLAALSQIHVNDLWKVRSYPFGNISPWLIGFDQKFPGFFAQMVSIFLNTAGLLQPFKIDLLCPMLVLEITMP